MIYITQFNKNKTNKVTKTIDDVKTEICKFTKTIERLEERSKDIEKVWIPFKLPKKSGGFREIHKTDDQQFKTLQSEINSLFKDSAGILESEFSYAYVEGRCSNDADFAHANNESNWFVKLDIKDFFGSVTEEVFKEAMRQVYPICAYSNLTKRRIFEITKDICFHNGALPQGGVASPFLSNMVMIPYLYKINEKLKEMAKNGDITRQKYILTCYADDIYISGKNSFNWEKIRDAVKEILKPAFELNTEKTKYTSSFGRNHILGKTINKDHNVTQGWKSVNKWKRLFLELCNEVNGSVPERCLQERQSILGRMEWDFKNQKDYLEFLIKRYEEKYTKNGDILKYLKKNT